MVVSHPPLGSLSHGCGGKRLKADVPVRPTRMLNGRAFVAALGATDDAAAVELRGRRRRQALIESRVDFSTPCSLSRISGCRDRGLYPLARPRAERHLLTAAPIPF
jgi:hypothetical protein